MNNSIYNKSVRPTDNVLLALIYMAAGFSILLLIGIMGYVFVRGIPQISWEFLSTVPSTLKGTNGIVGNIVNTLYILSLIHIFAGARTMVITTKIKELQYYNKYNAVSYTHLDVYKRQVADSSSWTQS